MNEIPGISAKLHLDHADFLKGIKESSASLNKLNATAQNTAKTVVNLEQVLGKAGASFNFAAKIEEESRKTRATLERMQVAATVTARDIAKLNREARELATSLPKAAVTNQRALDRLSQAGRQAAEGVSGAGTQVGFLAGMLGKGSGSLAGFTARMAGAYGAATLLFKVTQNLLGIYPDAIRKTIEWESAFAGVRKTVDGTEEELNAIARSIRNLSLELPIASTQIARIAELGGQLGVTTSNLAEFTRVVAGLVISTDLTAEEAATAIAQFISITGAAEDQVDNIASVLVRLGNTSATTEQKILDMSLRIAGAGDLIGLTEPQILGMAAALSSLGVRSEAGGTALQELMITIARETKIGSAQLDVFAGLAEETREGFQRLLESHPEEAIIRVVEGIAKFDKAGGNAFKLLDDLKIGGAEMTRALLGLANSQDLMREKMEDATREMSDNEAMGKEVEARLQTTASKLQTTANKWTELKIAIAENDLPTINVWIDGVNDSLDTMIGRVGTLGDVFEALLDPLNKVADALSFISNIEIGLPKSLTQGSPRAIPGSENLGDFMAYQRFEAQNALAAILAGGDTTGVDFDALAAQADSLLDQIEGGGGDAMRDNVNAALDRLTKGSGGRGGASAIDQLKRQGDALYRSLNPAIDLIKTAQEQIAALKASGHLDDDQKNLLGEALWKSFGDMTESELTRAQRALEQFDSTLGGAFGMARTTANQAAGMAFWQDIQPPDIRAFDTVADGIKKLTDAGKIDPASVSVFADWVYRDTLGQVAPEAVQRLIDKVSGLGETGKATADELTRIREIAEIEESAARGDSIWRGLETGQVVIEELQRSMLDLMNSGRLMTDPDAAGALSIQYWNQYGNEGRKALESLTDGLAEAQPEYAAILQSMSAEMDGFKRAADFSKIGDHFGDLSGILSHLPSEFKAVAEAAKAAQRVMNIAANAATGNWAAVATEGIALVVESIGLMGDKTEEEAKGIDKLFEELGDAVEDWGQRFTDTLVEFVKTGEASFTEFVNSVLEDILRLTIQTTITDPIVGAIQGAFSKGAVFDHSNIVPFAKGGVVSKPTIFPMAKGLGLMGEAGPEAVMPLKRAADGSLGVRSSGGGGSMKVEIIDQRSASAPPIEYTQTTGPNGEQVLRAFIKDEMKREFNNGGLDRAMRQNYRLRRGAI